MVVLNLLHVFRSKPWYPGGQKKVVDGYPSDEVGVPSDNVWLLKKL